MWDHIQAQQETQVAILHDIVGGTELNLGVLYNGDNPGKQLDLVALRGCRQPGVTVHVQDIDRDRGYSTTAERKKPRT